MLETRWLDVEAAAKYLSYSKSQFRELAREYSVPRHGPKQNRYDKYELDAWMEDPNSFKSNNSPAYSTSTRRKPGGWTPVHSLLSEVLNDLDCDEEHLEIVVIKRK